MQGKKCGLAVECPDQIVAHAHVIEHDASAPTVKADHLQVLVYDVLDFWAKLPVPVPEKGMFIISDAKDAVILWPKNLVILSTKPVINAFDMHFESTIISPLLVTQG